MLLNHDTVSMHGAHHMRVCGLLAARTLGQRAAQALPRGQTRNDMHVISAMHARQCVRAGKAGALPEGIIEQSTDL